MRLYCQHSQGTYIGGRVVGLLARERIRWDVERGEGNQFRHVVRPTSFSGIGGDFEREVVISSYNRKREGSSMRQVPKLHQGKATISLLSRQE